MALSASEAFASLSRDDSAITPDAMESFAASIKRELAVGGAELHADVADVVAATRDGSDASSVVVVDVRSPGEFAKGHIPGAVNVPLFTDEERASVGMCFAKRGRGPAMVLGMRAVRPKLDVMHRRILALADDASRRARGPAATPRGQVTVYVHCWRGGMRSCSVTWLLLHASPPGVLDARVLRGGYKAFRRWALSRWTNPDADAVTRSSSSSSLASSISSHATAAGSDETVAALAEPRAGGTADERQGQGQGPGGEGPDEASAAAAAAAAARRAGPRVCIVGGRTGVGKTRALLALRDLGAQVIDLEGLAAHSGSAFGWVGRPARQPTSEHFGNLVACAWSRLAPAPAWVFIEDEGPHVGKCSVDPGLFKRMRHAPLVINVVAPERVRLRTLTRDYASPERVADPGWLPAMTESVGKLAKRLGGKRASELSERLREGEYAAVAEGLLEYYDGLYDRHLGNKRVDRRKEGGGRAGEREKGERTKGGDGDATDAEEEARGGKTVVVHANGIGPEGDELDAETLAREILEATRAFDAEEEADASREGSDD